MKSILFVCHGNICRSPMAEFLFKKYVKDKKQENIFHIESRATSFEEIGNGIYPPVRKILDNLGINYSGKVAMHLEYEDYLKYDYIIGMDSYNIRNIIRITKDDKKVFKLLDFAGIDRDVSDPWYTRDFKTCYDDIMIGIEGFYNYLLSNKIL
jgi:protein-tyrosine phosphatase